MLFFGLFWLRAGPETERWGEKVKIRTGVASEVRQERFNETGGTKG
jgi:hypothetical protein